MPAWSSKPFLGFAAVRMSFLDISLMNFLLYLARSAVGVSIMGWVFAHASFLLPVKRTYETDTLLAFHHPKPGYPVHILIVPKKAIRNLMSLQKVDRTFLREALQAAHLLAAEFCPPDGRHCLILNGGAYQEVPQLHFHFIAGDLEDLPSLH